MLIGGQSFIHTKHSLPYKPKIINPYVVKTAKDTLHVRAGSV